MNNPRDAVTLTLNKAANVRVFEPANPGSNIASGDQPVRTVNSATTLNLDVPDSMMIVEIGGGATTPGTTGGSTGGTTGGTGGATSVGPCNLYANTSTIPAGYGVPWNTFTSAKELYLKSDSNTDGSIKYTVGSNGANQYVYNGGYFYANTWNQFTLAGTLVQDTQVWLTGQGAYTNPSPPSGDYFWVGYVCHWIDSSWKCGCRDNACTTNYWQLQGVKR